MGNKGGQRTRKRGILSIVTSGLQHNHKSTNQEPATPTSSEPQSPLENTKNNAYQSSIEYNKQNRINIISLSKNNKDITLITKLPKNGIDKEIAPKLLKVVWPIYARLRTLMKKQSLPDPITQSDINGLNQLIQAQNDFLKANFGITNIRPASPRLASPRLASPRLAITRTPTPPPLLFGDFLKQENRNPEIGPEM